MAEIRINATGGVKLYDADDSHYAQILAGTISSNVDALTLGSSSADFNIPVKVLGTTPTLTIGDAGAEDTKIVFDGNAQDFYIALDDSADDLLIGLGSTVGSTPAIAIDENLKVNIPVTTASTSASTGSLTTGGGAGIGADLYVGDDAYLITDSAVLGFGADKDTTLTHTDGTGLTLNSTNKLCFNDASQFVQGSSATVLSIGATDEIDLTATAVDLNGTLNVSGVATFQATPVFPDGSLALADLDIDGGTDIGADLVDADEIIVDDGGGGTNRRCDMSRVKTYIDAGPSIVASQWRLTTDFNGAADPIASNLEKVDTDGYNSLGSDMTESSGIFTFPSTGIWYIQFNMECYYAGDSRYNNSKILTTTDNSSYNDAARATGGIDQVEGATTHTSATSTFLFDVSNTTNCKVRFSVDQSNSGVTVVGDTNNSQTCMMFIRLGDT